MAMEISYKPVVKCPNYFAIIILQPKELALDPFSTTHSLNDCQKEIKCMTKDQLTALYFSQRCCLGRFY